MRIRFLLTLLVLLPFVVTGQSILGSVEKPTTYSLLELSTKNFKGGIRMPPLTTVERDNLTTIEFIADKRANGLAIYNSDTKCIEYWNTTKWVSLCSGSADISFKPNDPTATSFPPEGATVGPFIPVETPLCTGQSPYAFVVVTGSDFMTIDSTDSNTGAFTITMAPNPTALVRTAILRAINNCTGEYKEFIFSQEGATTLCSLTVEKPLVSMSNNGVLCIGGDVFMEITNVNEGTHYIWTINNIIQGQGTEFRATQSGTYKVYVGAIGCDKLAANGVSDDIIVTKGSGTAPNNPTALSVTNNGVICGTNGAVTLTAYNFLKLSELTWYKDGKETNKTGNTIILKAIDQGEWTAVIKRDGCISLPSQKVIVSVDKSGSPLKVPMISINDEPLSQLNNFCSNGRLKLTLSNPADDYTTAVTVKWYNGLAYLGEGTTLTVAAPSSGDNFILRCVVSDNTGVFCEAEFTEIKTLQGTAPATPVILASPPLICGSANAQLTASVTGGPYTFQWYKEGVLMPGEEGQALTVAKIGAYQVEAIDKDCISSLSATLLIGLSDFPILEWKAVYDEVELGQTKIFQVSDTFNPTSYTWTADNEAIIENGDGTNTVRIKFPNEDAKVNITVLAENDCGISNKLSQEVTVAPACIAVAIKKTSMDLTGTVLAGGSLTMSVVVDGSNTTAAPITYQWKLNGTPIAGATFPTYTVNNIKTTDSGAYTCAIDNCSNTVVEATAGTISVINEASLPLGSGTLAGEDCFDIASPANNNTKCGLLAVREPLKADFSKSYTYTFTSIGASNKDLRFVINDPEKAVESYEVQKNIPDKLGNGTTYTITVKYKQSLMSTVKGRDNANPVKITIVALFTTGGVESKSKLEITVKDCVCCTGIVDREGNMYTAKQFGNACWMTQNLRATTNKDGGSLGGTIYLNLAEADANARVTVIGHAGYLSSGTVSYKLNDLTITESRKVYASKFGLLYDDKAASTACPKGWHLPKVVEWKRLSDFLGGENIAGKKMKNNNSYSALKGDKINWGGYAPTDTNNSGFNALPAGRIFTAVYPFPGISSAGFSYSANFIGDSTWFIINANGDKIYLDDKRTNGTAGSIRCVRD